jgi:hypothetical protein
MRKMFTFNTSLPCCEQLGQLFDTSCPRGATANLQRLKISRITTYCNSANRIASPTSLTLRAHALRAEDARADI